MYVIDGLLKHIEKDNWENGADPETSISVNVDVKFTDDTIKGLLDQVSEFIGTDCYTVNPCEDDPSRVDWQLNENDHSYALTEKERELFKQGKIETWLVDYTATVEKHEIEPVNLETELTVDS